MPHAGSRRRSLVLMACLFGLAVLLLALMLSQGAGVSALDPADFDPTADITLSDYDSGVNADLTNEFGVPFGDYNYSTFISFIPMEFFPGEDVPLGAKVGELDSLATLGLLNGPCFTPLAPHFDLYRASTDTSETCTFEECCEPSSIPGLKKGVVLYPSYLTRILPGETPAQRMFDCANVGGSDVSINFVVLEAGALGYPAAWGRPSVTLLNDIGDPRGIPEPSAITSFCSPLESETVTFGLSKDNPETGDNEAGYEVRRNPAYGGTYTFHWFAESMIDADGDGIANYNDTCPYDVNMGDFRLYHTAGGGDGAAECAPDAELGGDGIDCACDPDPNRPGMGPPVDLTHCWEDSPGTTTLDCDGDMFDNRGDNCPLVANPDQADADADTIGDECDLNPTTPDGEAIEVTLEEDVDISGPPPVELVEVDIKPGSDPNSINLGCHGVIPVAILTTEDFDAATVDPATVAFADASPKHFALEDVDDDGDVDLILHFKCQQVNIDPEATEACLQASTYDGQQVEGCDSVRLVPPHSPADSDADGFTDAIEICVGTDLSDDCPDDLTDDAWPPDMDNDTDADIMDVLKFKPVILSNLVDPNYHTRFDLDADGDIDIVDILKYKPVIMTSCTP